MRIANRLGRAVLVDPRGARCLDVATVSRDRFGPSPAALFEEWTSFTRWASTCEFDFDSEGEPFQMRELQAPSPAPAQTFAIGLNYRDHADESGLSYPAEPPTFTKFRSSFAGPEGELALPAETVDWEVELVAVIGSRAHCVPAAQAWEYVAGLTVGQDFSERTLQITGPAPQFSLAKSYPGFAPQGPWLVTLDEFEDPRDLAISCRINGESVQSSRTSAMIFDVPMLIERLSAVTPLIPGDVIFTGTPSGVGAVRDPKWFLKPGDVIESTIAGIGTMRQTCITT